MSTNTPEPITDLAHLGHLELLTPKPEESLRFFVDVMGMTESGRKGDSVYLRAWDDYERYSLQLTASKTSGLGHVGFRARSPQALERRVKALEQSGLAIGWHENELGHGHGFRFHDPDEHVFELYYETEWYDPPPELRPSLKNQAQRYPARGVSVRRLDHFNVGAEREGELQGLFFHVEAQADAQASAFVVLFLQAPSSIADPAHYRRVHEESGVVAREVLAELNC